jgi:uncharacterized protein (TIGR04255 family)
MPATKSLQEIVIATHFQAPIQFGVMDLADWVGHFPAFPIVQQLPALAPANLPPGANVPQLPFQILQVDAAALPRMLLRSSDGRFSIQLQNDRFALGWHRTEPIGDAADYPGYEKFAEKWAETLHYFETWTQERFKQRPGHRLMELTYANAAPLERDGKAKRLSQVFKFVQPSGRPVNSFNTSWIERVYKDDDASASPRGLVTISVALGTAPPALPVLGFTFTGLAAVAPGEESKHILDDIHAKIREIYESSVTADAD